MQLRITRQFADDFKQCRDPLLQEKCKTLLEALKMAQNPKEMEQCKAVYGNDRAYKIGIGFYYVIGYLSESGVFTLMRWVQRDQILEMYRK